jgi:hypothetical protein
MAKYKVSWLVSSIHYVIVEADSSEEAIDKSQNMSLEEYDVQVEDPFYDFDSEEAELIED